MGTHNSLLPNITNNIPIITKIGPQIVSGVEKDAVIKELLDNSISTPNSDAHGKMALHLTSHFPFIADFLALAVVAFMFGLYSLHMYGFFKKSDKSFIKVFNSSS